MAATTTTVPAPTTLAEAWERAERIVYDIVHDFCRKHGCDFEDVLSECHEYFMNAWRTFSADAGRKWESWCGYRIRINLTEKARRIRMRENRCGRVDYDPDQYVAPTNRVPSDVATILEELAFAPDDVVQAVYSGEARCGRNYLRVMLRGMGWSREQVADTFRELTEAL